MVQFSSGEKEYSQNNNVYNSKKFSPNHALLYELSDLNSSTNSILFTNSSNGPNIININAYKHNRNEGPVKLNESYLKAKFSNSLDKKNFIKDINANSYKRIINNRNTDNLSNF